ncbi:arsenite methyltransferase [Cellulomonas soli]
MSTQDQSDAVRAAVREHYGAAAREVLAAGPTACCTPATDTADPCCGPPGTDDAATGSTCCGDTSPAFDTRFGAALYEADATGILPREAVLASLGCGNPTAVAALHPGERVLDLGSGGGIDVLLSARRVGPTGHAIGVDMTPQMLELARANAQRAGLDNVEFRAGTIEDLPLEDASVDVVISNCVVNLSPDKPAVLREAYRVLAPGGRLGISDIVAEDRLTPADRAERGDHVGCIAGALSRGEYLDLLSAAGFLAPTVEFTHEVADGMHGAIVQAHKAG